MESENESSRVLRYFSKYISSPSFWGRKRYHTSHRNGRRYTFFAIRTLQYYSRIRSQVNCSVQKKSLDSTVSCSILELCLSCITIFYLFFVFAQGSSNALPNYVNPWKGNFRSTSKMSCWEYAPWCRGIFCFGKTPDPTSLLQCRRPVGWTGGTDANVTCTHPF